INNNGEIIMVNAQTERLFGYRREELLGQYVEILIPERFRNKHCEYRAAYFMDPRVRYIECGPELLGLKKAGSEFPVEISLSPFETEEGIIVLANIHDITERKQAEEIVKQKSAQLAKTNEILRAEITERMQAEERLSKSLGEKEVLLNEIHHRVKNNLQIISSLLNLQFQKMKSERTYEEFNKIKNRIKSMALIHDKFYQSEDMSSIKFKEYIKSLSNYLLRSYEINPNHIKIKTDVEQVLMSIEKAIPCGLIINELISNSLNHAFPNKKKGQIKIILHRYNGTPSIPSKSKAQKNNKLILSVSNNGVNFPKDLDFRNTNSLGLQLVCELTDQLRGRIELIRSRGTRFNIIFTA
ncbi:MAG: histidine kinase dimerization/phosphoacceptor domain -containing protein, partial [Nitrososphaeraceae archaeon]